MDPHPDLSLLPADHSVSPSRSIRLLCGPHQRVQRRTNHRRTLDQITIPILQRPGSSSSLRRSGQCWPIPSPIHQSLRVAKRSGQRCLPSCICVLLLRTGHWCLREFCDRRCFHNLRLPRHMVFDYQAPSSAGDGEYCKWIGKGQQGSQATINGSPPQVSTISILGQNGICASTAPISFDSTRHF